MIYLFSDKEQKGMVVSASSFRGNILRQVHNHHQRFLSCFHHDIPGGEY